MNEIIKLTVSLLSKILSVIKTDVNKNFTDMLEAIGKERYVSSTGTTFAADKYYGYLWKLSLYDKETGEADVSYKVSDGTWHELTQDNLPTYIQKGLFLRNIVIPKSYWATATPFNDVEGMISNIVRGETAGGRTKWLLYMKTDSEDQTYTAGKSSSADYYGKYTVRTDKDVGMWELWLPTSISAKSVLIDW